MKTISLFISLVLLSVGCGQAPSLDDNITSFLDQRTFKAYVLLYNDDGTKTGYMSFTGTIFQIQYKNKNYMMTNKHVCEVSKDGYMQVLINNGTGMSARKILKVGPVDLCLLEPLDNTEAITISDYSDFEGEIIYTLGYPADPNHRQGQKKSAVGVITSEDYTVNQSYNIITYPFLTFETSLTILGGASGSPVVNHNFQLVGVVWGRHIYNNQGLVVSHSEVLNFLKGIE